ETCIALKDHESQPIGVISVKINGILFQCRRNVEFFTRDHQLVSESVHRCYSAGTCDRSTCENMSPTEKSKEFSFEANNNPGYTFCTPSCGCLTCDVAAARDSIPFSDIPSWTNSVCHHGTSTTTTGSTAPGQLGKNDLSTQFQLRAQGQISAWNNLKFSLIGTVVPQLPILSSTFAETDYSISVIKPAHRGQLSPHSAGQLQCSTKEHADTFNCSFAINACQYTPPPRHLVSKNFKIFSEDKKVYARTNIGSALQLHVVAENMKITARQSNSTCTIEASDLVGCYNCIAGAELTLYCQSSGTETTANIECPSQTQMALCTSSGYLNILKFHFDTSSVSMICNASCPGGTVSLAVKGVLLYVDDDLIRDNLQSEAKTRDLPRDTTFLSQIPNKFKEFVEYSAAIRDSVHFDHEKFLLAAHFDIKLPRKEKRLTAGTAVHCNNDSRSEKKRQKFGHADFKTELRS
ncbi:hypothetical protein OSTOST_02407, partial [Ostertagia ostertagi]